MVDWLDSLDFNNLTDGQDVSSMFTGWGTFGDGYGTEGDTGVTRGGNRNSSIAMTVQSGSTGRPGDGAPGTHGDFGFFKNYAAAARPTDGDERWVGTWVYFPVNFDFTTNNTSGLKFIRNTWQDASGNPSPGKQDILIHHSTGTHDGYNLVNEELTTPRPTESETFRASDRLFNLGAWNFVCEYIKFSSTIDGSIRRVWVNDQFVYEQVGAAPSTVNVKWWDGSLQTDSFTVSPTGDFFTLPSATHEGRGTMFFTYWNGGSPSDQQVNMDSVVWHDNPADLQTDTYGNKYINSSQVFPVVATPTNFTATGISVDQINLSWDSLASHQIEFSRSTDQVNWTTIRNTRADDGDGLGNATYKIFDHEPATTYYYRARHATVDNSNNTVYSVWTDSTSGSTFPSAGDVYVSPSGSDSTGDGSIGNPYATIQKGYDSVVAGGRVLLRAGTYTGQHPTYTPFDRPVVFYAYKDGTSEGTPIVVQGYQNEIVYIDGENTKHCIAGKPTGTKYNHFKNLIVNRGLNAGVYLRDSTNDYSSANWNTGLIFWKVNSNNTYGDGPGINNAGFRLDCIRDCIIRDCAVNTVDFSVAGSSGHHSAFQSYTTHRSVWENCLANDGGAAAYFVKDQMQGAPDGDVSLCIRYCKSTNHDTNSCKIETQGGGVNLRFRVYNNIFGQGKDCIDFDDGMDLNELLVEHNFIYATGGASIRTGLIVRQGLASVDGGSIKGNIFHDTPQASFDLRKSGANYDAFTHNFYTSFYKITTGLYNQAGAQDYTTLSSWQSATGNPFHPDLAGANDAVHSLSLCATDAASGDFSLPSGSPLLGVMSDGTHAGPYRFGVEQIGVWASSSFTTANKVFELLFDGDTVLNQGAGDPQENGGYIRFLPDGAAPGYPGTGINNTNITVEDVSDDPLFGTVKALRSTYYTDRPSSAPYGFNYAFGNQTIFVNHPELPRFHWRARVRFSSNWEWGQDQLKFAKHRPASGESTNTPMFKGTAGNMFINKRADVAPHQVDMNIYAANDVLASEDAYNKWDVIPNNGFGPGDTDGTFQPVNGQWYWIDGFVDGGSAGAVADGRSRVWIDGVEYMDTGATIMRYAGQTGYLSHEFCHVWENLDNTTPPTQDIYVEFHNLQIWDDFDEGLIVASGGSGTPTQDSPVVTSTSVAVNERTSTAQLAATNSPTSWALSGSGVDNSKFSIDSAGLLTKSGDTFDYESPDDVGADGVYNITVTATNAVGTSSETPINLTITDLTEPVMLSGDVASNGTDITILFSDDQSLPTLKDMNGPPLTDVMLTDSQGTQLTDASGNPHVLSWVNQSPSGQLNYTVSPAIISSQEVYFNHVQSHADGAGLRLTSNDVNVETFDNPVLLTNNTATAGITTDIFGEANITLDEKTELNQIYTITNLGGEHPTLDGDDHALFSLRLLSGDDYYLTRNHGDGINYFDYHDPEDANTDNVYNFNINWKPITGTPPQVAAITVTVADVLEAPVIYPPVLAAQDGASSAGTLTSTTNAPTSWSKSAGDAELSINSSTGEITHSSTFSHTTKKELSILVACSNANGVAVKTIYVKVMPPASSTAVDLGDYTFFQDQDISDVFSTIHAVNTPDFKVKLPAVPVKAKDLTFDVTGGDVEILGREGCELKAVNKNIITFQKPDTVLIDDKVRITGNLAKHPFPTAVWGDIEVDYDTGGSSVIRSSLKCHANFSRSPVAGLWAYGGSSTHGVPTDGVQDVEIVGEYNRSALRLNDCVDITIDIALYDPTGEGVYYRDNTYQSKRRRFQAVGCGSVTGVLRCTYGISGFFGAQIDDMDLEVLAYNQSKLSDGTLKNAAVAYSPDEVTGYSDRSVKKQIGKIDSCIGSGPFNVCVTDVGNNTNPASKAWSFEVTPGVTRYGNITVDAEALDVETYVQPSRFDNSGNSIKDEYVTQYWLASRKYLDDNPSGHSITYAEIVSDELIITVVSNTLSVDDLVTVSNLTYATTEPNGNYVVKAATATSITVDLVGANEIFGTGSSPTIKMRVLGANDIRGGNVTVTGTCATLYLGPHCKATDVTCDNLYIEQEYLDSTVPGVSTSNKLCSRVELKNVTVANTPAIVRCPTQKVYVRNIGGNLTESDFDATEQTTSEPSNSANFKLV